jgi:hypothetical protein
MATSKFSPKEAYVRYQDTRKSGGISIRGVELQTDADGFIEGPADLEKDIAPHGFILAEKWFAGLPAVERLAVAAGDSEFHALLSTAERALLARGAAKK